MFLMWRVIGFASAVVLVFAPVLKKKFTWWISSTTVFGP
jgi:hypothetical protein